jgi:primosomal protein N' (replication factor Y)
MTTDLYAEIALPLPLNQTFSYLVPEHMREGLAPGMRAVVPFGKRFLTGIVLSLGTEPPAKNLNLREIQAAPDEVPLVDGGQLRFIRRLSGRFHAPIGEMLQAALPPSFIVSHRSRISLTETGRKVLAENGAKNDGRRLLEALGDKSYSDAYLRTKVKIRGFAQTLHSLERQGLVRVERLVKTPPAARPAPPVDSLQMEMDFSADPELMAKAEDMTEAFEKRGAASFLLFGGRTRREAVYRELLRRILPKGRRVLFLTPDIALSGSLAARIQAKLGRRALVLHSRQTDKKREEAWQDIGRGAVDVVFGPRSALFSPLPGLGLIIVENEDDPSYHQQENPVYDARAGAEIKGEEAGALVVLGSSRPTVESFHRAAEGKSLIHCGEERALFRTEILDDRREGPPVHPKVKEAMAGHLSRGLPLLLFLNRRGYASYLICSRCGFIPRCRRCEIALSYHRSEGHLLCHYCSAKEAVPRRCPQCGGRLRVRGMGIEGLTASLKKLFPGKRIQSFDSDTLPRRKDQDRVVEAFRAGRVDILLGTQLLARRSDVPPVSLAVVFQPESLLALADFQASQKCFAYLSRAGDFVDREGDGLLLIQTALSDHYAVRAASSADYSLFHREEIEYRRLMHYPPFARLAEVLLAGENLRALAAESRRAAQGLGGEEVEVLGPALVPTAKISGRYRVQIICKSASRERIDQALERGLAGLRSRKKVFLYG